MYSRMQTTPPQQQQQQQQMVAIRALVQIGRLARMASRVGRS
jgi:hypothetical protein